MPKRNKFITAHPVRTLRRAFEVDVHLDPHTGKFHADLDGQRLEDERLPCLRDLLQKTAEAADDCIWEPFIYYGLEGTSSGEIARIGFWSQVVCLATDREGKRYRRDAFVDTSGKVVMNEDGLARPFIQAEKSVAVPYSHDRYKTLAMIEGTIRSTFDTVNNTLVAPGETGAVKWLDDFTRPAPQNVIRFMPPGLRFGKENE